MYLTINLINRLTLGKSVGKSFAKQSIKHKAY